MLIFISTPQTMTHSPVILQPNTTYTNIQDIKNYTFPDGIEVFAVCDLGVQKDSTAVNEDAIGLHLPSSFVVVADGMGGEGDGDKASHILVEELCASPLEKDAAVMRAKERYVQEQLSSRAGAVFVAARIYQEHGAYFLEETHCGDALLFILSREQILRYSSQSDAMVAQQVRDGEITEDEALYSPIRHFAGRAVTHNPAMPNILSTRNIPLHPGDFIFMMSDGIADNFTSQELITMIKVAHLAESVDHIMKKCTQRMQYAESMELENRKATGVYSDGYLSEPKKDNRSFVILHLPSHG